jgi:hypothetical protein
LRVYQTGLYSQKTVEPISLDLAKKYFDVVDSPDKADFAFGLSWSGVINDDRVKKYK